jgi:hypothetical protein
MNSFEQRLQEPTLRWLPVLSPATSLFPGDTRLPARVSLP